MMLSIKEMLIRNYFLKFEGLVKQLMLLRLFYQCSYPHANPADIFGEKLRLFVNA